MQVSCLGPALNAVQASCGAEVPVCNSRQRLSWKARGLPPLHASQHQQQRQIGHVLGQRAGRFCGNAADLWRHGAPLLPRCGRRAARGPQATANILPASDILAAVQMPLGRDMADSMAMVPLPVYAAMLFSLVGAIVWVKLFDFLARREVLNQKLSRKLVHITAGPLFVLTWPLFSWAPHSRYFAAVIPALQALRLVLIGYGIISSPNTVRAVSREGDRGELLRGPLYYVLILAAVTVTYWRESAAGLLVIALMCGGDGLADIVGRRFGAAKLPHNHNKSWAGSLAMFLGSLSMAWAYMALFARLGYVADPQGAVPLMAGIAAAATVTESLPINQQVDDNLSVPAVAAVLGHLLLHGV